MAELVIQDKYSGKRLDHADFAEVCKTTFAKGVITDFKQPDDVDNPNDPIQVEAMVKVEIDEREYDEFIPLFFCPRKDYWDTEEHASQEFNDEDDKKYFENAWMSFRGDDEVRVMLRDGKPVAVLGFLDGIPRVGEDIIELRFDTWNEESHIVRLQCSKQGELYGKIDDKIGKGPDGLNLGLTKEAEILCDIPTKYSSERYHSDSPPRDVYNQHWFGYKEYLIPVGAIAYIFQVQYTKFIGWESLHRHQIDNFNFIWVPNYTVTTFSSERRMLAGIIKKDTLDEIRKIGIERSALDPGSDEISINRQEDIELPYESPYPDFYYQKQFNRYLGMLYEEGDNNWIHDDAIQYFYQMWGGYNVPPLAPPNRDILNSDTLKIYHRPHTKEEIEAA